MIISNERCWLQYQIAIDDLSDFNYSIFQNSLPSVERFQAQLNPVVYFLTSVLFSLLRVVVILGRAAELKLHSFFISLADLLSLTTITDDEKGSRKSHFSA